MQLVEGPAVFGLELLIVAASGGLSMLFSTMGKTAFVFISTLCCFNPVFAQLCLVLAVSVALDHHMIMLVAAAVTFALPASLLEVADGAYDVVLVASGLVCVEDETASRLVFFAPGTQFNVKTKAGLAVVTIANVTTLAHAVFEKPLDEHIATEATMLPDRTNIYFFFAYFGQ